MTGLREQLVALEQIQELDLQLDSLKKLQSDVPVEIKQAAQAVAKAESALAAARLQITEGEKLHRQTQSAREMNAERLAKSQSRFEQVQNTTEFQAVQKELEQLRKAAIQLDEQFKKLGEDLTKRRETEATALQVRDAALADQAEKVQAHSGTSSASASQLGEFTKKRSELKAKVEPRNLAMYDRVRAGRAGLGMSPAVGGRCKCCNMALPPQQFIEVQKCIQLQQCTSCLRIFFIPA